MWAPTLFTSRAYGGTLPLEPGKGVLRLQPGKAGSAASAGEEVPAQRPSQEYLCRQ